MRKSLLVSLALVALLVALPVRAGAASNAGAARKLGDQLVRRLVQQDACDTVGEHGMFGKGTNYLASCTGAHGEFRFLVVVPVRSGIDVDTQYIRDRIDEVCAGDGGAVFSAGVSDRFAALYLGTGDDEKRGTGAYRAARLFSGLSDQLSGETGAFRTGRTCADGKTVAKVA